MTKEDLQKYCDEKELKVKILHIAKCENFNDYEVIYTFNLSYNGRDYSNVNLLIEPELDELCEDEEEFYFGARQAELKERENNEKNIV